MQRTDFIVEPYLFTRHSGGRAFTFIGQDVWEKRPGELWMFTHYGRKPTDFTASDLEYRTAPILKSRDGGRSWKEAAPMPLPWDIDGWLSDGGVSVLPLISGRILFVSHRYGTRFAQQGSHGVPAMSTSDDDGQSWSPARLLVQQDDIYYVMNQRLIQLQEGQHRGRLVLPVSTRDPNVPLDEYGEGVHPCLSCCFLSDDEGKTWRLSSGVVREPTQRGAQEPCVAEVGPGQLVLLYRSGRGCHQASFSGDGGETWSEPEDTSLTAACSPLTLSTLPDGQLIVAYNHAEPAFLESYYPRNPLCYAVSDDGGRSWSEPVLIDNQPGQQLIYPSVTGTAEGLLFIYCAAYAPADGTFNFPADADQTGGGKCCVLPYPPAELHSMRAMETGLVEAAVL